VKPRRHNHPKIHPMPWLYGSFWVDTPKSWLDEPWAHVVLFLAFIGVLVFLIHVLIN